MLHFSYHVGTSGDERNDGELLTLNMSFGVITLKLISSEASDKKE
jgi:hypothetical protein